MPTLDIQFNVIGQHDAEMNACRAMTMPPTKDNWLRVHRDQDYTLQSSFHRYVNKTHRTNETVIPKVYCPKFPKNKDEGWFLVLGAPYEGELIAMKRCSYRNTRSTHQVTFRTPNKIGRHIYTVYIMSDSYLGFDQQYDLHLEVVEAVKTSPSDDFAEFGIVCPEKF